MWPTRSTIPGGDAVADLVRRGLGPTTTSMGRLFDAVAALLGLRSTVTYEGQAAIGLESLARSVPRAEAAVFDVDVSRASSGALVIDPSPLLVALLGEHARGIGTDVLAAAFHESIGRATARAGIEAAHEHGLRAVALSGGVFQNVRLTEIVEEALVEAGLEVLVHLVVPPNDGGISIGQAAIASARSD